MTETPLAASEPKVRDSQHVGFLSVLSDPAGLLGGLLVTNNWGRPVEFRWSSAIQPNRVQQILYGPTLEEYVHAELIGKTLVDRSTTPLSLLVSDDPLVVPLRAKIDFPLVIVGHAVAGAFSFRHSASSQPIQVSSPEELDAIKVRLDKLDPAIDLMEPFSRIREAIQEARKIGGVPRAA